MVLDLTFEDDSRSQKAEREAAGALGVRHVNIPLYGDGTGGTRDYARAVAVLADSMKQGRPILVHCSAGAPGQTPKSKRSASSDTIPGVPKRSFTETVSPERSARTISQTATTAASKSSFTMVYSKS